MEYSSLQLASPYGNAYIIWDHSVTCHPTGDVSTFIPAI